MNRGIDIAFLAENVVARFNVICRLVFSVVTYACDL